MRTRACKVAIERKGLEKLSARNTRIFADVFEALEFSLVSGTLGTGARGFEGAQVALREVLRGTGGRRGQGDDGGGKKESTTWHQPTINHAIDRAEFQ